MFLPFRGLCLFYIYPLGPRFSPIQVQTPRSLGAMHSVLTHEPYLSVLGVFGGLRPAINDADAGRISYARLAAKSAGDFYRLPQIVLFPFCRVSVAVIAVERTNVTASYAR